MSCLVSECLWLPRISLVFGFAVTVRDIIEILKGDNSECGAQRFKMDKGAKISRAPRSRGSSTSSCSLDVKSSTFRCTCVMRWRLQVQTLPPRPFRRLGLQKYLALGFWTRNCYAMNVWFGLVPVLVEVVMVRLPVEVCSVAARMSGAVAAATWSALAFATQRSAPPASTISALVAPPHLAPSSGSPRSRVCSVFCGRLLARHSQLPLELQIDQGLGARHLYDVVYSFLHRLTFCPFLAPELQKVHSIELFRVRASNRSFPGVRVGARFRIFTVNSTVDSQRMAS
ncbi:hypothetical protein B0H19DRAFT_1245713 [Mycena capillaripes]|nr:hypothetical protein B0H19DRAFT_1245713 [Mycena capillaripes]